jgi:hypothetical protein
MTRRITAKSKDESTGEAPDKQLLKLQAEEVARDDLPPTGYEM